MKLFNIILMYLIGFLFASSIGAGAWSGNTIVTTIYPHATNNVDGTIYLVFDVMKNPDSCSKSNLIALKKSNKLSAEIYSLLLTAYTTGEKVTYYANGCGDSGYPVLLHIQLRK